MTVDGVTKKENPYFMPRGYRRAAATMMIAVTTAIMAACVVDDVVVTRDASIDADQDLEGCQVDTSEGPRSAQSMTAAGGQNSWEATGIICPMGDTDWYELSVPVDHRLARTTLTVRGPMSPIQPVFTIYECDTLCLDEHPDDGPHRCCILVTSSRLSSSDDGLGQTHCLPQGEYYFVVSDMGDDNVDVRYPRGEYVATISTIPDSDSNEPNDEDAQSAHIPDDGIQSWRTEGRVNCRGDQDWFTLDESDGADFIVGNSLSVSLDVDMPVFYHPQLRVLDNALRTLGIRNNLEAAQTSTYLTWSGTIQSTGPYYFVIEDDDGVDTDTAIYELSVNIVPP